ncbi:hypothetical protein B0H11DRAFT_2238558 [Mycena galericulata]|nr:hypothetical protein B0H11DRAFT_2238558 [Mycena galericulata]
MSYTTISVVAVALLTVTAYRFLNALNSVNHIPGMRPLFAPMSLFGAAFGTRRWNPGMNWPWEWRKTGPLYSFRGYTVISRVIKYT